MRWASPERPGTAFSSIRRVPLLTEPRAKRPDGVTRFGVQRIGGSRPGSARLGSSGIDRKGRGRRSWDATLVYYSGQ